MRRKTIVVTGGNGGIGQAIVRQFKDDKVVVLDKTFNSLDLKQSDNVNLLCDISDSLQVENTFLKIYSKFGYIDILINCAGIQEIKELDLIKSKSWKKIINTNLHGTFFCIKSASKYMKKGASIITISSIHSSKPRENKYSYDATKAALTQLSLELAITFAKRGIRVNVIEPGYIDTPMNESDTTPKEEIINNIPLGRIGKPSDIAKAVKFLSSNRASYITGTILSIDGGRRLVE